MIRPRGRRSTLLGLGLALVLVLAFVAASGFLAGETRARGQSREAGRRVTVERERITVHDGDTFSIEWSEGDRETVRLLGIDTPEIEGSSPDAARDQPFGQEAAWFARGALATTDRVEILRASILDRYGRTLAYFFLDGRNYSVLALEAHLAYETIGEFGEQGLPREAKACLEAAAAAGPPPFERPSAFRERMREGAKARRSAPRR